ncbi:MFS transporter [Streptomyces albiaxialis]|uniref:MFS transporter n=1 Tax=Streptomyces albiaxialis TaxID=329523 RepID=A0ABN2VYT5_9ACTN
MTSSTAAASGPASAPPVAAPAPRLPALLAALLGFFVITIDVSAVNIALPAVGEGLDGGMAGLQWVVDSYTLMFAALMLSAGSLSDRIGARRAYGWGLGLFTAASLACGLAPTMGALIAARVAQGAAAAVMMPTSLALIRQAYAEAGERARAVALWTAAGAVALAAGPVLGGLLTSALSWRAVFFINLPVGVLGVALLARVARSPRRPAPLDAGGQLAAVTGPAALTYAVIEGGHGGYGRPSVLGAFALALAAAVAFLAVESRAAGPMVPPSLFRRRAVAVPVVIGFTLNAAFYGTVFLLGLYFQQERGLSPLAAGATFVPMAAATTVTNVTSPRLTARFGAPAVIVAGLLTGALGVAGLAATGPGSPTALAVLLMVPVGVGGALAMPPLTSLMLDSVDAGRAGTAAAVLNTSRQVGGALSVALFGTLVTGDFAAGMRVSLLLAAALVLAAATLTAATLRHTPPPTH